MPLAGVEPHETYKRFMSQKPVTSEAIRKNMGPWIDAEHSRNLGCVLDRKVQLKQDLNEALRFNLENGPEIKKLKESLESVGSRLTVSWTTASEWVR